MPIFPHFTALVIGELAILVSIIFGESFFLPFVAHGFHFLVVEFAVGILVKFFQGFRADGQAAFTSFSTTAAAWSTAAPGFAGFGAFLIGKFAVLVGIKPLKHHFPAGRPGGFLLLIGELAVTILVEFPDHTFAPFAPPATSTAIGTGRSVLCHGGTG